MFGFRKRSNSTVMTGPADRYIKALSLLDQAETLVPEATLAIGEAKSAVMEQLEAEDPKDALRVRERIKPPVAVICGTCQGKKTMTCPAGCGEDKRWTNCAACHGRGEVSCYDCESNSAQTRPRPTILPEYIQKGG